MMKSSESNMDLLEKRNQSLHESHERTRNIYKKAAELGLVEIYKDFNGQLRFSKTLNKQT